MNKEESEDCIVRNSRSVPDTCLKISKNPPTLTPPRIPAGGAPDKLYLRSHVPFSLTNRFPVAVSI